MSSGRTAAEAEPVAQRVARLRDELRLEVVDAALHGAIGKPCLRAGTMAALESKRRVDVDAVDVPRPGRPQGEAHRRLGLRGQPRKEALAGVQVDPVDV